MFAKFNISFNVEGGGNILKDPTINKLLILLKVINNYQNNLEDTALFSLLHFKFLRFEPLDILKLTRVASKKRSNIIDTILSTDLKKIGLKDPDKFILFINQLANWQQLNFNLNFTEFFEILLKESNFLNWVLSSKTVIEKLNKLNSLFLEIKKLNTNDHKLNLNSFLKALNLMEINHLKIIETDLDIQTNSITLSTAHKAKGKEWEHVFIYKAIDQKWGNNRTRELIKLPVGILKNTILDKKEKNEDERRLFYVCLTRARKNIYISYADKYITANYTKETFPTMFIKELPQNNIKYINVKSLKSKKILNLFLSPASIQTIGLKEQKFLKNIIENFKLSPTALNTYLTCPYKFKLNNLLKVPRSKISYLSFGSAIHRSLEMFYKKFIKDNKPPNKKYLLIQYKYALKKEVLIPEDFKTRLEQGKKILSDYFDNYKDLFVKPLCAEKFFGSKWSKTYLGDIPLSGKVDRIDWVNQKEKTVKVIDYKTGKPKSRNDILGKTKYSEGDYYRQLVFYKLLSQLNKNFQLKVVEAELDFIETNSSGKFKKESFKISDTDINNLKEVIKQSMKKIRSLDFPKTEKRHHCDRCEYQTHCYPNGFKGPNIFYLCTTKTSFESSKTFPFFSC